MGQSDMMSRNIGSGDTQQSLNSLRGSNFSHAELQQVS